MAYRQWITPFKKQCFVTLGVVMNMAGFGMVLGYTTSLLTQLRRPDSYIPIDDSSGSWIAAIIGIAMLPGNFISPLVMGRFGRRSASIVSIVPSIIGWLIIVTASNISSILIARCLHGLTLGMISNIGPILIGEYTSPRNRGAFLAMISFAIGTGTLSAHTLGLYLSWQNTALVFAGFTLVNLFIVVISPESPSWLIDQGRYEESRKVFRWLRGDGEEDELKEMIIANMAMKQKINTDKDEPLAERFKEKFRFCKDTIKKEEFYKPVYLLVILYTLSYWGGGVVIAAYIVDIANDMLGKDTNVYIIIVSAGVQRLFTTILFTYIVKKYKRRTIIFNGGILNFVILLITAIYVYLKKQNLLPFDHVSIGILLIHLHVFSLVTCTLSMPFIIAGELFPLEYRSISSAISVLSVTPNMVISLKTFPFLLNSVGLYGTYSLYAVVIGLCFLVLWWFLPETKDRTLQDIENELRGVFRGDMKSGQPLTLNVD